MDWIQITLEEFRKKYADTGYIDNFIYRTDLDADHECDRDEESWLRDLCGLFLHLFPECDPYRKK